jgi:hypothetical protein
MHPLDWVPSEIRLSLMATVIESICWSFNPNGWRYRVAGEWRELGDSDDYPQSDASAADVADAIAKELGDEVEVREFHPYRHPFARG